MISYQNNISSDLPVFLLKEIGCSQSTAFYFMTTKCIFGACKMIE